ncbi:hypothetical protein J45TS6_19920 [Paenibacillus sp. J45TS6]|uniref:hypothetical protein n=1 Tax=Paenibacillus sp. J45TS6 TaxID=2807196 RepID=UPI001B1DD876|nr:hypothetical protein [Paenibacillus sp. J45TS6]GIP43533.1 hypothetical protein J45TS6_19920 [Paenibacillus sp. J45TS6]
MDGSRISFKPSELTKPETYKILNDTVELVGTSLEKSQIDDSSYEVAVSLYGEMENEIGFEQWKAHDSTRQSYDISMRGSYALINTLADSWRNGFIGLGDRNMQQPFEFQILGLDQIPEEITLVREVVNKRYSDDLDWSVLIE